MEMDNESIKSKFKSITCNDTEVELRTKSTHPSHEKAIMDKAIDLAQKWQHQDPTDQQID